MLTPLPSFDDLQRQLDFTVNTLLLELPTDEHVGRRQAVAHFAPVLVRHILEDAQTRLAHGQEPALRLHTGPHPLIGLLSLPHGPGGIVLIQDLANTLIFLATQDPAFPGLAWRLSSSSVPEERRRLHLVKLVDQIQHLLRVDLPLDQGGTFAAFQRRCVLDEEVKPLRPNSLF